MANSAHIIAEKVLLILLMLGHGSTPYSSSHNVFIRSDITSATPRSSYNFLSHHPFSWLNMVGLASALTASAGIVSVVHGAGSSVIAAEPQFTIPASVSYGATLLPNVDDPQAADAQSVCRGYRAAEVQESQQGFTATLQLAGEPCNVYGLHRNIFFLTGPLGFEKLPDRPSIQPTQRGSPISIEYTNI